METKVRVVAVAILIVIGVGLWASLNLGKSTTVESMKMIKSRVKGNGTFLDYDKTINVESVKDLGWWKAHGDWHIQYGSLELQLTPAQLKDKSILWLAKDIGLEIYGNVDEGNLRFYWYDQKIAECIPR